MLFSLIYFSKPMKDRSLLSRYFAEVPIYSANGDCSNQIRFSFIDTFFEYDPTLRCLYSSAFIPEETIKKYEQSLASSGWKCFREGTHVDWYDRSYFKNGLQVNVLFRMNRGVDMSISRTDRVPSAEEICYGASIKTSEPIRSEGGVQYTPASRWVINSH